LRAIGVLAVVLVSVLGFNFSRAATNLYSTQFETAEGYDENLDLVGQLGWTSGNTGTIWNGLTEGFIAGQGQHAYIGFAAPTNTPDLFVWQPINFDPLAAGLPIVKFSVQMQIVEDTPEMENFDDFRWSVYNTQGHRLFSLDFDNLFLDVNYLLDGTNELFLTGIRFTNEVTYTLAVTMNFASNRWSATVNSTVIATNQLITTVNAPLNLGDVDAVWSIYDTNAPGDNYMVFDNYQITAESITVPPPPPSQIRFLSRTSEGWALLRVFGQAGSRWSVDATTNFTHWTALTTNTVTGASFDHVDMTATGLAGRFYRARFVP
jgi:hypothetical protein